MDQNEFANSFRLLELTHLLSFVYIGKFSGFRSFRLIIDEGNL